MTARSRRGAGMLHGSVDLLRLWLAHELARRVRRGRRVSLDGVTTILMGVRRMQYIEQAVATSAQAACEPWPGPVTAPRASA